MGKTKEEFIAGARVFGQSANTLGVVADAVIKEDEFTGRNMIALNIIPTIVLKAFSCELFLKSIVPSDKLEKKHELDELFNLADEIEREKIKEQIKSKLSYSEDDFKKGLKCVANAFVAWRYFFEEPREIDLSFLNAMFDVLWNYFK